MEHNVINTNFKHDRVSSTYAEIYLDDSFCEDETSLLEDKLKVESHEHKEESTSDEWISPSDQLIGIIELKPPFTSKINRAKTHEGILHIGNTVLEQERSRFLKSLTSLIEENDASWQHILTHEREAVNKKVKQIYENIFNQKSKIMTNEISAFYENNLQELEEHLKSELQTVLQSSHASMVSLLNNDIKLKLRKEKKRLEDILRKRLLSEVKKINKYYNLLLRNEISRNENIISHALRDRNDAIGAFLKQIEAEKLTSSMYVMSVERKRCKINKLMLQSHHDAETTEKLCKLKEKREILDSLRQKDVPFMDVNKEWEEKIAKILQLFLKFISFSLKLLPEQTTFLLDLEKMVILQLNEIQKQPGNAHSLLYNENDLTNTFDFADKPIEELVCEKEPFTIIGDLSDPIPPRYGSTETLPIDVDLPVVRLQRQYVYAKCHGYEDIKKILKSQVCRCHQMPSKSPSIISDNSAEPPTEDEEIPILENVSSEELFLCENFKRLPSCPARSCTVWMDNDSFPFLPNYTDYSEVNYERVTAILGKSPVRKESPELIKAKDVVYRELPFSATKERYHTTETQYSSQEDINVQELPCTCTCLDHDYNLDTRQAPKDSTEEIKNILNKRKISLQRLMRNNPNLLNLFTDEIFDVKM
ncbi:uncharacterized protein LOC123691910 [Colias croceus]|uniref:uncharacterized protein LOC123691910 n=1 Tax=Colias crocea TaxID=72248 RepID=UPI001E27ECAB|nr:uncharacterized protein LOC123691910 [Colias croceus]